MPVEESKFFFVSSYKVILLRGNEETTPLTDYQETV